MATTTPSVFSLEHFLRPDRIGDMIAGVILILLGWFLARSLASLFERSMAHRLNQHQLLVRRRLIYHGILLLFIIAALQAMGLNLSVLLGAAGILSVAIGFASQTSASNLISGIFLIGERSFAIGDVIRVGQTEGEVLSIDLLSVKLRTSDNLYVRLPNEQLIKTELINLTRFAIRRINLPVGIAYKEDINRVRLLLLKVAEENPLCLDEPTPEVIMQNFGDSAISLSFYVWVRRENFSNMRDQLQERIKAAFDEAGIEIPFPQVSINASSDSTPLPLRILREAKAPKEAEAATQPGLPPSTETQ
ncbi:MAG: mechanosensitive ion channel family protein [Pedobacter sp.]|nr:mechanosensitive ion channel family protein [Pedobacter sp.]